MRARTLTLSGLFLLGGAAFGGVGHRDVALAAPPPAASVRAGPDVSQPRRVTISGYDGDAMEPFISRDGRYLLFNNSNRPGVNTDLHFARRRDDFTWVYQGPVKGVNTPALEGCPSMDRAGRLFFVSTRSYAATLCTIYSGSFKDGAVTDVAVVESVSRRQPGAVNFDVDVSADGQMLVFVDSRFRPGAGPQSAALVVAAWDGARFVRSADSARLLGQVNSAGLQYAPTLSADKRTLYFTRFDPSGRFPGPQIYRATRPSVGAPFGPPAHLEGLGDYVEGSALSPDERLLFFHRKDGPRFHLYAVAVRPTPGAK